VPALDFSKIYEWREQQNEEEGEEMEVEEEEFEEESDVRTEFKDFFYNGTEIESQISK